MKTLTKLRITLLVACAIIFFCRCTSASNLSGPVVSISNGKIKLGFEHASGKLISFSDLSAGYEFIDSSDVKNLPWSISTVPGTTPFVAKPERVTVLQLSPLSLQLIWDRFVGVGGLKISATVSLDKEKALSYWSVTAEGMKGLNIESITFPRISGIKEQKNEELAVATWLGSLIKQPRPQISEKKQTKVMSWTHPGHLSMQLLTLYSPDANGLYFSCNDTLSYSKVFSLIVDEENMLEYNIRNTPPLDNELDIYKTPYQAVIGSVVGDWVTAAKIYREWGTQQRWCRDSRFKNGISAKWLPKTALWVWNRGESSNVLPEAVDLQKRLGLPVNVFWHWWHNCSYDDGFPEYLPPREGGESFIRAVESAQQHGVHSIVYMNSFKWGDSASSWKTENAEPYSTKSIDGKTHRQIFNIFTNKSLTSMCMATEFWRNKYASLCDSVVNTYHTNGVYMDQACLNYKCYDPSHGHTLGGGNYWVDGFGKLTSLIRSKLSNKTQPILAGEGSGEDWIPYLDLFLTLETSRERYSGVTDTESIPLYQAVYHDYAITYGSYSSLVSPPYDELWPAKYNPANKEKPLSEEFNSQFLMEQARAFVWGMQPTIANYHSFLASERKEEIDFLISLVKTRYNALDYLLRGEFFNAPLIDSPTEEISISKLSIYAGRDGNSITKFKKTVPMLYTAAWRIDSRLGIALANISKRDLPVNFILNASEYNIPSQGNIYVITDTDRILLGNYTNGKAVVNYTLPSKKTCVIEFTK